VYHESLSPGVILSPQQGDALGVPLAAWRASSFQNGGIENE